MSKQKQITVFGGSGFIGRHIVRHLARSGAVIRIPTRDREKALLLKPAGDIAQIVPISCAVKNDASVARAIGGSDVVINLLGILYERGTNTFQSMHVETAARIARIAKEQGAESFVQMSALSASASAASSYSRSKAAGEEAVGAFFQNATILRPSIGFGPEDNFFNQFASMARFFPALPLINGGATRFQPVYVGDIAKAVAAILGNASLQGHTYELGGPQVYSFRTLLEMVLAETERKNRFFNMSWRTAKLFGGLQEMIPLIAPKLTRDQVEMLKTDNVLQGGNAKALDDLGLNPTALEVILPTYLDRFRVGGTLKMVA
jgi:uncharacterized protein YbjT (DUF2867 family)